MLPGSVQDIDMPSSTGLSSHYQVMAANCSERMNRLVLWHLLGYAYIFSPISNRDNNDNDYSVLRRDLLSRPEMNGNVSHPKKYHLR